MAVHFHPQPKGRPRKLEKADRLMVRVSIDERESAKVKARSGGQCEARWFGATGRIEYRCTRRAVHVHHRIGGSGKRARGASLLAENKIHLCAKCHSDIHAHVLVPDGWHFRRVR